MNDRIDPFARLSKAAATFAAKPATQPAVDTNAIDQIAEDNGFHSRPVAKRAKDERPRQRRYRTGRNVQLNCKATQDTIRRFHQLADKHGVPLGETLRLGVEALETIAPLQEMARRENTDLAAIVQRALDALAGAGRSKV